MPMYLKQSLRQELASYYLQLSQTFSFSQKGALKLEFSIVTLNSAIFMQIHRAPVVPSFPQRRGHLVSSTLLRRGIHTVAYTPLFALALNIEADKIKN